MDEPALYEFLSTVSGGAGHRLALRQGLNWALEGSRPEAAGGFIDYLGAADTARFLPVLIEADAPTALIHEAIRTIVLYSHKALPGLVGQAGGRQQFAEWCRRGCFELPDYLPDVVTVARGTLVCSPEQNASGMHWSIGYPGSHAFDGAAFFASGWPDPTVVIAKVLRSDIVYFSKGVLPYEVLIADIPSNYAVITDTQTIMLGAVRFAYHGRALMTDGTPGRIPFDPMTDETCRSMAELIAWWEARSERRDEHQMSLTDFDASQQPAIAARAAMAAE